MEWIEKGKKDKPTLGRIGGDGKAIEERKRMAAGKFGGQDKERDRRQGWKGWWKGWD